MQGCSSRVQAGPKSQQTSQGHQIWGASLITNPSLNLGWLLASEPCSPLTSPPAAAGCDGEKCNFGGHQQLPGCLVQRVPPRAKARCFRSVRRGPSEAVCEITCLERKFLQLAAGSCPSLGWLQRSHPFRIYLFFLKKSSPMGLGRGRGWCRVPIGVRPFPLHPLRRRVPKSLSGAFPGSFPRWLCPGASCGSGAGAPLRPAGHARGSFSLGCAHQLPHLQLGFAFGDAVPAAPLAPAAPTWVSLPLPPPFCLFIPFPGKIFPPRAGEIQWLSAASIVGPGMSWHAGLPVRKPDVAAGALRRASPGPAGWDHR